MVKLLIGLVLLISGIWINWKWHNLLESSGGPDYGRSILQYHIPYYIGAILTIVGIILVFKRLLSLLKRKYN